MSYCVIFYVFWELKEGFQKIHKAIVIDCFVSLDWYILKKPESSQFCELFLMVWFIFNQQNHQIQKFFS